MPTAASRMTPGGPVSRAASRMTPGGPLSRAASRVLTSAAAVPRGRPVAVPWAAPLYVGAVQLGAYATARLPGRQRTELLRAHSTNVANLRAGRWQTLVTSAAFVEEPLPVAYGAALLATLGTAEARWGTWRTAGVFGAGHVGASLLVYAALRCRPPDGTRPTGAGARAVQGAEATGAEPPDATARAIDVGASYGFNATVGALAATVPHRGARTAATAGLLALGTWPVLRRRRTFTDAGHLVALALGLAMGTGMQAGRGRRAGAK
ncbi:rhomboid-like protein [Streptomyces sp. NPDC048516]|uniref:rhomboid-like protein n=1 Tax=Streptomyces sp. NPDC048516 TaxID=3365565 RepID=UPI0037177520